MAQIVGPCVRLIARTEFLPPPEVEWSTDAEGGAALAEFAGRACYQSWSKSNPATASNADYLAHILEVGHLAVLEHASASFYLTGISRSLSHELVRHRHLSFSQLSPRYTPDDEARVVAPPGVAGDAELEALVGEAAEASRASYARLLAALQARFADVAHPELLRKQARQAARAVLPAATETRMVVSGNYRAWRHFIGMRATEHADLEIRQLAIACLRQLQRIAANVFDDFRIATMADGSEIATSPFVTEG